MEKHTAHRLEFPIYHNELERVSHLEFSPFIEQNKTLFIIDSLKSTNIVIMKIEMINKNLAVMLSDS